jgi:hypothetical protein
MARCARPGPGSHFPQGQVALGNLTSVVRVVMWEDVV